MGRKAFTLVEILVVVGIAGIIIIAALTPLTFTIRTIRDAQRNFSVSNKERFAVNQIFQDAREVVSIHCNTPFQVIHQDELGSKADDTLLLWTRTPSYSGGSMACVVYRMLPQSVLGPELPEGLYRWVISKGLRPEKIEEADIKPEEGRLVLPGIASVRFSVMESAEWVDEYKGRSPQALKVTLKRKEEGEFIYESCLPQF